MGGLPLTRGSHDRQSREDVLRRLTAAVLICWPSKTRQLHCLRFHEALRMPSGADSADAKLLVTLTDGNTAD